MTAFGSSILGSTSPGETAGHPVLGLFTDLRAQTLVTYMVSVHSRFSELSGPSPARACSGAASLAAASPMVCEACLSFFRRAQKLPPMKRAAERRKKLDM